MKSLFFIFILSVGLYPGNPSASNTRKKAPAKVQDTRYKAQDSNCPQAVKHKAQEAKHQPSCK